LAKDKEYSGGYLLTKRETPEDLKYYISRSIVKLLPLRWCVIGARMGRQVNDSVKRQDTRHRSIHIWSPDL
jgi:hypothetical protein